MKVGWKWQFILRYYLLLLRLARLLLPLLLLNAECWWLASWNWGYQSGDFVTTTKRVVHFFVSVLILLLKKNFFLLVCYSGTWPFGGAASNSFWFCSCGVRFSFFVVVVVVQHIIHSLIALHLRFFYTISFSGIFFIRSFVCSFVRLLWAVSCVPKTSLVNRADCVLSAAYECVCVLCRIWVLVRACLCLCVVHTGELEKRRRRMKWNLVVWPLKLLLSSSIVCLWFVVLGGGAENGRTETRIAQQKQKKQRQ